MNYQQLLAHYLRNTGATIPTARVSSAQARGRAARYAYWGVALYEIRLSRNGVPVNSVVRGASSDRRSKRLVEQDCDELCEREGRIRMQTIGELDEDECRYVLQELNIDPEGDSDVMDEGWGFGAGDAANLVEF